MSTAGERKPSRPRYVLRDRQGRPVDQTPEDRAERREALKALFDAWAVEDAASDRADDTDEILDEIRREHP